MGTYPTVGTFCSNDCISLLVLKIFLGVQLTFNNAQLKRKNLGLVSYLVLLLSILFKGLRHMAFYCKFTGNEPVSYKNHL